MAFPVGIRTEDIRQLQERFCKYMYKYVIGYWATKAVSACTHTLRTCVIFSFHSDFHCTRAWQLTSYVQLHGHVTHSRTSSTPLHHLVHAVATAQAVLVHHPCRPRIAGRQARKQLRVPLTPLVSCRSGARETCSFPCPLLPTQEESSGRTPGLLRYGLSPTLPLSYTETGQPQMTNAPAGTSVELLVATSIPPRRTSNGRLRTVGLACNPRRRFC